MKVNYNLVLVSILLSFIMIGNASADLNDGLVAYYPFNGNANDESKNSNDGIVYGATLTKDRFGDINSAYNFDGINDYISIQDGSQFNFNNNLSLSLWIKPKDSQADYAVILDKSHGLQTYGYPKGWVFQQSRDNVNLSYFGFGNGAEWSNKYGDDYNRLVATPLI